MLWFKTGIVMKSFTKEQKNEKRHPEITLGNAFSGGT